MKQDVRLFLKMTCLCYELSELRRISELTLCLSDGNNAFNFSTRLMCAAALSVSSSPKTSITVSTASATTHNSDSRPHTSRRNLPMFWPTKFRTNFSTVPTQDQCPILKYIFRLNYKERFECKENMHYMLMFFILSYIIKHVNLCNYLCKKKANNSKLMPCYINKVSKHSPDAKYTSFFHVSFRNQ